MKLGRGLRGDGSARESFQDMGTPLSGKYKKNNLFSCSSTFWVKWTEEWEATF